MNLLRAELARLASRPTIVLVLAAMALVAVILAGAEAWDTRPPSATERQAAERSLALAEAVERPGDDPAPVLADFLPRDELDLGRVAETRGSFLVLILTAAGVLIGATFTGADWASGAMRTQLLTTPRRLRVWLTKGLAVVIGATGVAALVLLGFWGALATLGAARGLDVDQATWSLVAQSTLRGLALVAAATLGGHALTMLLRHTTATLGLLFLYAVAGEGVAAAVSSSAADRLSLPVNLTAWVRDGVVVFSTEGPQPVTATHAASYLGALLLLAAVVSVLAFTRRDVA